MNNINTLLTNNNIIPLYSNYLDEKTSLTFSEYFSNNIYLKHNKETMGALYYYKYQIDGIIFISTYRCNTDAIINNIAINQNNNIPTLKLIINENITNKNQEIKITQFINIVKEYYDNKYKLLYIDK